MSPLPQRKKSAEELAKLRESLGIPGLEPGMDSVPAATRATLPAADRSPQQTVVNEESKVSVDPVVVVQEAKEVRSLKRSERAAVLHPDAEETVEKLPPSSASVELPVATKSAGRSPKVVRSLRKSEQGPVETTRVKPVSDSKLPVHRHSDEEIGRIRRMQAISAMAPQEKPRNLSAHLALVVPGYLLAVAGSAGVYFYDLPLAVTAALAGTALLIALFIFIRKPLSRHHAAFIVVAVLFLTVFGALHYFPQIQHGT